MKVTAVIIARIPAHPLRENANVVIRIADNQDPTSPRKESRKILSAAFATIDLMVAIC
jgi:hypothetical protein